MPPDQDDNPFRRDAVWPEMPKAVIKIRGLKSPAPEPQVEPPEQLADPLAQEFPWLAEPEPAPHETLQAQLVPTLATTSLSITESPAAEFTESQHGAFVPAHLLEPLIVEAITRRNQPQPKPGSSWLLLAAGAGLGAGATAIVFMFSLPAVIGAVGAAVAPAPRPLVQLAATPAPAMAISAAPSATAATSMTSVPTAQRGARSTRAATADRGAGDQRARVAGDPPPGALPVIELMAKRPSIVEVVPTPPPTRPATAGKALGDEQPGPVTGV